MNRALFIAVTFLGTVSPGVAIQDSPRVVAVSPISQSMVAARDLEIIIDFDQPIQHASLTARSFAVFGRWSGVCSGEFVLENHDQRVRFLPQQTFSAGEWVTVSLSKGIQGKNGARMAKGYAWNFWTQVAPGALDLKERETVSVRENGEGRIRTYGAYAGDLDGDGYQDFTVPNEDASDVRVFLNDGGGNYDAFEIYPLPKNSVPSTNEGADFNGDGLLDFACGNIRGNSVTVFLGDGAGGFASQQSYPTSQGTRGLAVLDLNGDGAPDIVTANRRDGNISKLINRGDGVFHNRLNQDAGTEQETACVAADFNEDGILDVAVGSYAFAPGGANHEGEIVVLLGDGDGGLAIFSTVAAGGDSWMLAAGDMNNDGHADIVSANSHQNEFALLLGDGRGRLSQPEPYTVGEFPLAIDVGDLDGDGDLDVVCSNFGSRNWTIYENDGYGRFIHPRTIRTSAAGSCAVLHDRDRDGDLDMTGIDEIDDALVLFENPATPTSTDTPPLPSNFSLAQSYPNPFSGDASETNHITIPFSLQLPAKVRVEIYNTRGQSVGVLINSSLPKGDHNASFRPRNLPAGMYFYRLSSANVTLTRKLLLLH